MARLNPNLNPDPNPNPNPDPTPNLLVEHGGGATQQRQRNGGAAEAEEHRAVISRDLRVVRRQAVRAREERQRGGIVSTARGGERGEEVRLGVDVRVDVRARVWGWG